MNLTERGIITGVKPIGGWRYPQRYGDGFTTIEPSHAPKGHYASHGDKLVEAVRLFRRTHGLSEGDPALDVAEFIRRASPQNDYYRGKVPDNIGKPRIREIKPLIESVREWLDNIALRKPRFVSSLEATDRAEVCMRCPQNIRWQINCGECNTEVDKRGVLVRGEVSFELDSCLNACRLHKLYLQAAVFIDRDYLPDRHPDAPEHCWIPAQP